MSKKVFYGNDARERVFKGVEALYNAVKVTYGPRGNNVVIDREWNGPTITHDGVTVAEVIDLPYNSETLGQRTGAALIKQAAGKLNKMVGDGTTTVTILTHAILLAANKMIEGGESPQKIKRSLDEVGKYIIDEIDKVSEQVSGNKLVEVATISAGDSEIGKIIADVFEKIGKDGVVEVEEGRGFYVTSEIVDGFTFDKGLMSNFFITNLEKQETVFDDCAVIITTDRVETADKLIELCAKVGEVHHSVAIIAEDIEPEVLGKLVNLRMNAKAPIVAVKAPSFGDRRKDIMNDIAILTGGVVCSKESGYDFDTVAVEDIGSCDKIIVNKDLTAILGGRGNVKNRIKQLKLEKVTDISQRDKDLLQDRIAALSGKVAVIKVGGNSETEIEELKYRIDDAVAATKAAQMDGIVPGGGVTLRDIKFGVTDSSVALGVKIMDEALLEPFKILLENAEIPYEDGKYLGVGMGINVVTGEECNVKKAGIIDPTMVTKEVVRAAISVAGTACTMGALVVDEPEPK